MKPIRHTVHFLWRATVLPIRLMFGASELTFRAGVKVGGLPVRGSRAAVRAVGWKIAVTLGVGTVAGFLLGREVERRLHARHHHDGHDQYDELDDLLVLADAAQRAAVEGAA